MDARTLKSERRLLGVLAVGGMLLAMALARPLESMVGRGATVLRVLDRHAVRPTLDAAADSLKEMIGSLSRDGEPARRRDERPVHRRILVVHWFAEPEVCTQDC